MSWGINLIGTREEVKKRVAGNVTWGDANSPNAKQHQRAKDFIVAEIDALPDPKFSTFNGVQVDASGNADSSSNNMKIEVKQTVIALPAPEPLASPAPLTQETTVPGDQVPGGNTAPRPPQDPPMPTTPTTVQ